MPSYIPNLGGVLVAHSNAHYLRKEGLIDGDSAFSLAPVSFDAIAVSYTHLTLPTNREV